MRRTGQNGLWNDWYTVSQWNKVVVPNVRFLGLDGYPEIRVNRMLEESNDRRWLMYHKREWRHVLENRTRQMWESKAVKEYVFHIADDSLATMARLMIA